MLQQTVQWDAEAGVTRPMRGKEEAHDYRYFPDPDLLPLELTKDFVDRLVRFFGEDLVFRLDRGAPIPGRILEMEPRKRVQRDEITGEPLPVPEGEG